MKKILVFAMFALVAYLPARMKSQFTRRLPSGLPMSLQVIGQPFAENTIFKLGYAYQQVTAWHERRPLLGTV